MTPILAASNKTAAQRASTFLLNMNPSSTPRDAAERSEIAFCKRAMLISVFREVIIVERPVEPNFPKDRSILQPSWPNLKVAKNLHETINI
jgi:hypothetical protein